MKMQWTAIWQDSWPLVVPSGQFDGSHALLRMTLSLEFIAPPVPNRHGLRLWQGKSQDPAALYCHRDGRLQFVHGPLDVETEPDFARPGETIILHYRACAEGRQDLVELENADRHRLCRLRGAVEQEMCLNDLMPRDERFLQTCHIAAIAPFGVVPNNMPGFVSGTRLQTPNGPKPVDMIQAGDPILTRGGQAAKVQWIEARPRLSLGRRAAVRLHGLYFGLLEDLIVTPQSRILRTGPSVEYIFGQDAVLIEASDLVVGSLAIRDRKQPLRLFYHLMLDDPACVLVDRCAVETARLSDVIAAEGLSGHHSIESTEADTLVPVIDRAGAQALLAAGNKGRRSLG